MGCNELFGQIQTAIVELDDAEVMNLTEKVVTSGADMVEAVEKGYTAGIRTIGEKFESGEVFLPELVFGAKMVKEALTELEKLMPGQNVEKLGKFIMGTVAGDIHDIGKDLVVTMLSTRGIEVIDIGVDCPVDKFIDAAIEHKADIIGASCLLTMTLPELKKLAERMQERGVRDDFKFVVGGAAVSQEYADMIGADGYGADLKEAVDISLSFLSK